MKLDKTLISQCYVFLKPIALVLITCVCLSVQSAYAAEPNVATMLMNFSNTIPQFMRLVTATAYVLGFLFMVKGVMGLKEYGESRTQMSSQHSLKGPLILMAVGTVFLYLPSSVQSGISTFWDYSNPLAYEPTTDDQWSVLIGDCYLIIQLIGTIAFVRGMVIFTHMSGQGAQPGTFAKAISHIIAGILCINLSAFLDAVNNTLGLGQV